MAIVIVIVIVIVSVIVSVTCKMCAVLPSHVTVIIPLLPVIRECRVSCPPARDHTAAVKDSPSGYGADAFCRVHGD